MKILPNGCRVWEDGDEIPIDVELRMYKTGPMTMTRPQRTSDRAKAWKAAREEQQRLLEEWRQKQQPTQGQD